MNKSAVVTNITIIVAVVVLLLLGFVLGGYTVCRIQTDRSIETAVWLGISYQQDKMLYELGQRQHNMTLQHLNLADSTDTDTAVKVLSKLAKTMH